jgi:TolB-like protein/Flp pilus assembly protein TadD
VTEPSHAVFLSYASQDAEAAQNICEALRTAGIEVWFDQSELRGGDAWDQSIRKQIKTCALFIPVISRTTHDRREGYFRLEWKLAVDRCHLMDADMAFLLPVVIDDTRDDDERVPERFREVQWTRLPGGATPPAFVERVRRLLSGEPAHGLTRTASAATRVSAVPSTRKPVLASWRSKAALLATIAVLVGTLGYVVANRLGLSKRGAEVAPAIAFTPPPHSVAVLPFVNMSGDKEQEYFSDGLTEELLNSLSRINELQVAARTSSFSFQGEHPDIATVAHKLNVAAVLEGSVRRSAQTVRITAQLVNGITGFHLWSQTYDRDLGDVLALQTEIANAVASALKVTLLGDVAAKIELGGTHNPAAFDAYLRGSKAYITRHEAKDVQTAITEYTEAIRLDSNYALAFVARSIASNELAGWWATTPAAARDGFDKALADAREAIALAPELGEAHQALAKVSAAVLDFTRASDEYERAVTLAPGNAQVLQDYGRFAVLMGHTDAGVAAARRAVQLDPLNRNSHGDLSMTLVHARRYNEALAALQEALVVDPDYSQPYYWLARYALGNYQDTRALCELKPDDWGSQVCLAITYDKLGRHADAETQLGKLKASNGDASAYQYAQIYAQWGNAAQALSSLDTAMRLRDPGLEYLKIEILFDPLRKEPRFQAIMRELKFPN